jgi:hypothetical protein
MKGATGKDHAAIRFRGKEFNSSKDCIPPPQSRAVQRDMQT